MSLEGLLHREGLSRLFFEGEEKIFGLELYVYEVSRFLPSTSQLHEDLTHSLHSLAQKSLDSRSCPTISLKIGCASKAISNRKSEHRNPTSKADLDYYFSHGIVLQTVRLLSTEPG